MAYTYYIVCEFQFSDQIYRGASQDRSHQDDEQRIQDEA